ncbi:hypothetical protein M406DRAFT_240449, partial [Cryphonectria parasitica EP155]
LIDGIGCTVLPGLIDSHVHVDKEDQLDKLASAGVTAGLDMASWPHSLTTAMREASVAPNKPPRPAFLSAGLFATGPGSVHSKVMDAPADAVLTSPDQAEAFVGQRVAEGSDYIKLVADVPGPSQETLDALVREAQAVGKKTVAHAAYHEPFLMALKSGADCLTHVPMDMALEVDWARTLADQNRVVCPTLVMMKVMVEVKNRLRAGGGPKGPDGLDLSSMPSPLLDFAHSVESVRVLKDAGVQILVGTDANVGLVHVEHGKGMQQEMRLLQEAGMKPVEILRSATSLPALYWGLSGRGYIRGGAIADVLLVRGKPYNDINHISDLERVWIGG